MNIGQDWKNCNVNVNERRLFKGLSGDFQVSRIKAKSSQLSLWKQMTRLRTCSTPSPTKCSSMKKEMPGIPGKTRALSHLMTPIMYVKTASST